MPVTPVTRPHPSPVPQFLAQCLPSCLLSLFLCSLGPLIPYLSAQEHIPETHYWMLVLGRGVGFVGGGVVAGVLGGRLGRGGVCGIGVLAMGMGEVGMGMGWGVLAGVGAGVGGGMLRVGLVEYGVGTTWKAAYGSFAIGGLVAPLAVYLLELRTYLFLGIITIVSSVIYYRLQGPQQPKQSVQQPQIIKNRIPKLCSYLIAALFFLIAGQQAAFVTWISSYSVLNGFSPKQYATIYPCIYWASALILRILLPLAPGSPSRKIQLLTSTSILGSILSYYLIWFVIPQYALLLLAIFSSLLSSTLPLLPALPHPLTPSPSHSSLFLLCATLGQILLPIAIGLMMRYWSYEWLIYGGLICSVGVLGVGWWNQGVMQRERLRLECDEKLEKFLGGKGLGCSIEMRELG